MISFEVCKGQVAALEEVKAVDICSGSTGVYDRPLDRLVPLFLRWAKRFQPLKALVVHLEQDAKTVLLLSASAGVLLLLDLLPDELNARIKLVFLLDGSLIGGHVSPPSLPSRPCRP